MSKLVEERIAAFASRQHGVVIRPQLLASEVTSRMVHNMINAGKLKSSGQRTRVLTWRGWGCRFLAPSPYHINSNLFF